MGKTRQAVNNKIRNLGLKDDATVSTGTMASSSFSSEIPLPEELPTEEEALKMLAGALKTSIQGGLSKQEILQLQVVGSVYKHNKKGLTDYINYCKMEIDIVKLRQRHEAAC